jgi:hypothetical protein
MGKDLRIVIGVAVWAVCTACNGCFGCKSPVDQTGSTLSKACDETPPLLEAQKLDILFVVDNSNSMIEEQQGVADQSTAFVDSLRVSGGVAQDLRVGVITTSVYQHVISPNFPPPYDFEFCNPNGGLQFYCTQSGKLQPVPESQADGGFVTGMGSERMIDSSDPEFVPKFARLIHQGVSGSGQETPFEAIRLAFSPPLSVTPVAAGGNAGFLRDGARLLIVVMSDEDDCSEKIRPSRVYIGERSDVDYCEDQSNSLTPVSEYHDFIAGLTDSHGNLKEIVYTAIAPVSMVNKSAMLTRSPALTPDGGTEVDDDGGVKLQVRNIDCATSNEPGVRHRAMAESFFADLSNLDSICRSNYKDTLLNIANLAGVSQTLELQGVPDEHVLQVLITRVGNTAPQLCTVDNGGITWEPTAGAAGSGRIHFGNTCKRRRDDVSLKVDRLCIY